ncbi:OsmC family protein [Aeromicrobium senzhongii]|uniref:OsmC family protein n=1 Tax=Aeromicrobium senzhongii TaxID=2663859 RepID=A0ABX6SNY7_9ACTN|nr:OsmC family protein [Aeromicrobium senzhongii]MTB87102.1 OsmC family peroxiredoxin [Aeromicrobium senzhongii]QNL93083.1 OsmC family protein [Aeromicrobium senzhongii]
MATHEYSTRLAWAGSTGDGYRAYDRAHEVELAGGTLAVSADASFRGDGSLTNPEQLLLAAASSCQLLSFLSVAALAKIDVLAYEDDATALMPQTSGPMRITEIVLRPRITARGADESTLAQLVETAHRQCFIANTLNATVRVEHSVEWAS